MISKKHSELIIRYLNNTISKLEREYFFDLIEKDTSFKKEYFIQKDKFDYSLMKNDSSSFNVDREWNFVDKAIMRYKSNSHSTESKIIGLSSLWVKVAAIFLLSFGLGWAGKNFYDNTNSHNSIAYTITVPRGQQSKVSLTDGTEVWINSHSEIIIPADFSTKNRKLKLVGEAYFKVKRNPAFPFYVNTNNFKVKVLGTSFNVRAYAEEKNIITTLEKGKVQLISGTGEKVINPGEQLLYDKETKSMRTSKVITKYFTSWKDGKFYMNNMSFDQLVYMLEIWYDYKFTYNKNDFQDSHFTGVIKRERDIEYILNIINQVTPISYEINEENNEIILTKLKKHK